MRNKHPGDCYVCGERVEVGAGFFERHNGGWRTKHAKCSTTPEKQSGCCKLCEYRDYDPEDGEVIPGSIHCYKPSCPCHAPEKQSICQCKEDHELTFNRAGQSVCWSCRLPRHAPEKQNVAATWEERLYPILLGYYEEGETYKSAAKYAEKDMEVIREAIATAKREAYEEVREMYAGVNRSYQDFLDSCNTALEHGQTGVIPAIALDNVQKQIAMMLLKIEHSAALTNKSTP